ncbi:UDP-N-acetylmuramoyl-L-alanyl-D-glutamate--2,6-diaminopimelate ligase [Persicobacter psychrovividus]|uniref:UDP-N-acetylmuramoyl-L-alanyl-D-glutamate--2,6-diaminopimelate ligase n=1 Tax=Persicobacter psychrovividus TaxID=387638 RepID=A0ABM7VES3_9BACT|nr:UDP-N-acetylmuramoyl-L-alanyl-D-glutamate--2,6-diaminopimelate ligase [Persicobacter psychrovividus]
MNFENILNGVRCKKVIGEVDVEVQQLQFDSRKLEAGDVFIAQKGTQTDGHDYIPMAVARKVKAIVCEDLPADIASGVVYVQVENAAKALGLMACNYYDHPSRDLKLVAVTGTNGKTTTVTLLFDLFRRLGYRTGLLSTVVNKIDEQEIQSTHTTGDALQINQLLRNMADQGVRYCFMEASSHAIHQHRIAGLDFDGAVFTNISHDHLDYHHTFKEYIFAKKMLFDQLPKHAFALVNADDKRGLVMLQNCAATHYTYALKGLSDFPAKIVNNAFEGLEMEIEGTPVFFRLVGEFNGYNLMVAYGVAKLLGVETQEILLELSMLQGAKGRFQLIPNPLNKVAIVDYAHTPDALENVLKTIQAVRQDNQQIIAVVGCGGDRDKTKRPEMAAIAAKYSDKVVMTSDNPRTEDPAQILKDMEAGLTITMRPKALQILDRKEAIRTANMLAGPKDILLVAGKGHEDYQEINGVKHHFDDGEILQEILV